MEIGKVCWMRIGCKNNGRTEGRKEERKEGRKEGSVCEFAMLQLPYENSLKGIYNSSRFRLCRGWEEAVFSRFPK